MRATAPIRRRTARLALRLAFPALTLLLLASLTSPLTAGAAVRGEGVATLTGELTVTSPFVLDSRDDPYVRLSDLAPYLSNAGAPAPAQQVLGAVEGDPADEATFSLSLPISPQGTAIAFDREDDGVQVYSLDLASNAFGDPFMGPTEYFAWGVGISSFQIDYESGQWSGSLIVWAADDEQRFPAGPGKDGQLFTEDDPLETLDAGWTVVELDDDEFDFERDVTAEVSLLQAPDLLHDLSDLSFLEAFDALVADLRVRYAFNEYKEIDWDAIVAEVRPLVEEAEEDEDATAFNLAMMRFAVMLGDGHVGVGMSEGALAAVAERYGGGLGLTIGETDEGDVIVAAVAPDSPADEAGIEPGAEIVEWDGEPTGEALDDVELLFSESSPHGLRLQQLALLPRLEVGEEVELDVQNPGDRRSDSVELEAVEDVVGLYEALWPAQANPAELPVTAGVLPSGVGYLRVNTFFDDVDLMFDSWEWAMTRMVELDVPALVIDVRGNGGGWGQMALTFAGSFTDERFVLAEDFVAGADGEMQPAGRAVVEPAALQWEKPVAVLIDNGCASACEIFAAAMAPNPAVEIVGQTPTAGVEAGVVPWALPGGISFQASIYLMLDNDGEVFLEGAGVPPTIDVPVTAKSLVTGTDDVLLAAEEAMIDEIDGDRDR
jgi:C-terminal processing protease CtpA/Prc